MSVWKFIWRIYLEVLTTIITKKKNEYIETLSGIYKVFLKKKKVSNNKIYSMYVIGHVLIHWIYNYF